MAKNNKSQNTEKPVDEFTTPDPDKVVETPVTEGAETPVATDENPVVTDDSTVVNPDEVQVTEGAEITKPVTPEGSETPVTTDENPVVNPDDTAAGAPVTEGTETPVVTDETQVVNPDEASKNDDETPVTEGDADKKETKLNLFRRFDIRYASSVDKGVYVTRKNWSTSDLVNTFVKMPTSFIAFESKEDLEEFKKIIAVKEINVLNKDGKKVPFSKTAKEHLVSRLSELSDMWISKNSK